MALGQPHSQCNRIVPSHGDGELWKWSMTWSRSNSGRVRERMSSRKNRTHKHKLSLLKKKETGITKKHTPKTQSGLTLRDTDTTLTRELICVIQYSWRIKAMPCQLPRHFYELDLVWPWPSLVWVWASCGLHGWPSCGLVKTKQTINSDNNNF